MDKELHLFFHDGTILVKAGPEIYRVHETILSSHSNVLKSILGNPPSANAYGIEYVAPEIHTGELPVLEFPEEWRKVYCALIHPSSRSGLVLTSHARVRDEIRNNVANGNRYRLVERPLPVAFISL
ncbi:hypothetical protein EIP91_011403 [Steccherinum ochraceum]|uniref:BTB domain-containing protein n=1 Tax=Steccherinum ochraceum TaxID=92696 RepID=A0A4R0R290_9APHY|nr:hypothetical protein EIP91_011403 [Steccherinum ochraceum]